jgi:hypothetical protein
MDHEKKENIQSDLMELENESQQESQHESQQDMSLTALRELKESSQHLKQLMSSFHNSLNELEYLSDFYDKTQHLLDWVYSNCYVNKNGIFKIDKKEYTWLTFLKAYLNDDIKI